MGRSLFGLGAIFLLTCTTGSKPGTTPSACDPECGSGELCCESDGGAPTCIDVTSDPNNCGSCGMTCTSGFCEDGACLVGGNCDPECDSTKRCCGTSCVNLSTATAAGQDDSSFAHCGGCGLECDPEKASSCADIEGTPTCTCGALGAQCGTDKLCLVSDGTYRCVDFDTDKYNCGEQGNVCPEDENCIDAECHCGSGDACSEGSSCCEGTCVDTTADSANCGGCGIECGVNGPDCVEGECRCGTEEACAGPTAASEPGEICCDDECVPNEVTRCGGCDVSCVPADGGPASGDCIYGSDIFAMQDKVCCGMDLGVLAVCIPDLDGGLPFDAGLPDAEPDAGVDAATDATDAGDAAADGGSDAGAG